MAITLNGSNGITFPNSTIQASAGQVLQVVSATTATTVSNSTGTYADTGLTATITPKFSTSKILVMATINGTLKATNNTNIKTQLVRNSTAILAIDDYAGITGTTASNGVGSISCDYLDSPATTSATTYKVQFASDNANAIVYVQGFNNVTNGSNSTMVLMEIAQ